MSNTFFTIITTVSHRAGIILSMCTAIVLATSCGNEDSPIADEGQKTLNFDVSITNNWTNKISTKASTISTVADIGSFYVTARGNNKYYFKDFEVTGTTENGTTTWTSSGTYFWPDYALEFFAYAPTSLKDVVSINSTDLSDLTITDYTPAVNASDQKDVIVAYNSTSESANAGTVSLNFKHALSQIQVLALNSNSSTMQVDVAGVKISNVISKGTFTLPAAETTSSLTLTTTDNWTTSTDNLTDYSIVSSNSTDVVTLDSKAKSIMLSGNNWMLIPQTLDAWEGGTSDTGVYLSVLCRITDLTTTTDGTVVWPDENRLKSASIQTINNIDYAYSAVPIPISIDPGKKYIYTLNFFSSGSGGGQIEPGTGEPSTNDGTPIVSPITVTTTITDWDASYTIAITATTDDE